MAEPSNPSDSDVFEELIVRLRAAGYSREADRVDEVLHGIAWTTNSELLGELGLAIAALEGNAALPEPLRRSLKQSLKIVRRTWPKPGG